MKYVSTRGAAPACGFAEALQLGLAPDGGLYVPASWPEMRAAHFDGATELVDVAQRFLAPFTVDDPLGSAMGAIVREAFDFPAPLVNLGVDGDVRVLELFHGPTAAFKDFGARFLAGCFARLPTRASRPRTILVATSGDTGGAVAAAFHERAGVEVAVLFPKGLVSPLQERQLTCWGGNVRSFAVRGTFDDCQRMVKAAFADPALRARRELTSANSINLGRLLPQAAYYAWASLAIARETGELASFVIPSGNLGNAVACVWARRCGLPIAQIVLAHNANREVPDFLASGAWQPRASVATIASAMDVGDPSNLERLRALYPRHEELRAAVRAFTVDDDAIRRRIRTDFKREGRIWCPHSAVGAEVLDQISKTEPLRSPWVIVATAHPAKFQEIVEPLVGRALPLPPALASLMQRPTQCVEIEAEAGALSAALS